MNRSVFIGMTTGAAFMFGFGIVWLLLGLFRGRPSPSWLKVSILLAGIALGASIATLGARATRVARSPIERSPEQLAVDREVGKHFYLIFGLELAAIIVAVVVLTALRYPDYILCGIALIVGVHFFPLAALFRMPFYYVTGLAGCAIGLVGFFMGDAMLRQKAMGLSFGVLLWTTATWITWHGLSLLSNVPTM